MLLQRLEEAGLCRLMGDHDFLCLDAAQGLGRVLRYAEVQDPIQRFAQAGLSSKADGEFGAATRIVERCIPISEGLRLLCAPRLASQRLINLPDDQAMTGRGQSFFEAGRTISPGDVQHARVLTQLV